MKFKDKILKYRIWLLSLFISSAVIITYTLPVFAADLLWSIPTSTAKTTWAPFIGQAFIAQDDYFIEEVTFHVRRYGTTGYIYAELWQATGFGSNWFQNPTKLDTSTNTINISTLADDDTGTNVTFYFDDDDILEEGGYYALMIQDSDGASNVDEWCDKTNPQSTGMVCFNDWSLSSNGWDMQMWVYGTEYALPTGDTGEPNKWQTGWINLNAYVTDLGSYSAGDLSVHFEYGTTTSYGYTTPDDTVTGDGLPNGYWDYSMEWSDGVDLHYRGVIEVDGQTINLDDESWTAFTGSYDYPTAIITLELENEHRLGFAYTVDTGEDSFDPMDIYLEYIHTDNWTWAGAEQVLLDSAVTEPFNSTTTVLTSDLLVGEDYWFRIWLDSDTGDFYSDAIHVYVHDPSDNAIIDWIKVVLPDFDTQLALLLGALIVILVTCIAAIFIKKGWPIIVGLVLVGVILPFIDPMFLWIDGLFIFMIAIFLGTKVLAWFRK